MGLNGTVITHKHSLPPNKVWCFQKKSSEKNKMLEKKKTSDEKGLCAPAQTQLSFEVGPRKKENTHQGKTKRGRKPNSGIPCPF